MLTFNNIKSALVAVGTNVGKVHLVSGESNISISGVHTLGAGELWVIPVDKTQPHVQVTSEHTLTVLS